MIERDRDKIRIQKIENMKEIYSRFSATSLTKSTISNSLTARSSSNLEGKFITHVSNFSSFKISKQGLS